MTKLIDRVAHTQTDLQENPLVAEALQHWNMVKEKTQVEHFLETAKHRFFALAQSFFMLS